MNVRSAPCESDLYKPTTTRPSLPAPLARALGETVEVLDDAARIDNERFASRREMCACCRSNEELNVKLVLDLLDPLADDRLPDIELMRGGAEAAVAGAGNDVS